MNGCTVTTIDVAMRRDGEKIQRTATQRKGDDPNAAPEQKPIETTFTGPTPADVRGAGMIHQYASSLGTVTLYAERFRGEDDLAAQIDTMRHTVDANVNLLIGWFDHELKDEPRWPVQKKFFDETLRRDAMNLGLYMWTGRAADDEKTGLARAAWYLVEHAYLSPDDAPRLVRMMNESNDENRGVELMGFVQRWLAKRMGIAAGEPVPDSLAFLSDQEKAKASFTAWYQSTQMYKDQLAEWEKARALKPDLEKPTGPPDSIGEYIGPMLGFEIFGQHDFVRPHFDNEREPLYTSGRWDPATKTLALGNLRMNKPLTLPAFAYAVWAEPNEAAQTKAFGRVIFRGESLAEYVVWRASLPAKTGETWDAFLATLAPGDGLAPALEHFHFNPPADADDFTMRGIKMIDEAMTK
ncbi:MAG: hypothetical protein GC162_20240 [Planctomycetes bacterium]|nr:hypothetical protein [Planctomycetota bacterium]